MSLEIFDKECDIPSNLIVIKSCDKFFDRGGVSIPDTAECRTLLQKIDGAQRYSATGVKFPWKEDVFRAACLSTGMKALICILARPDICFNVSECGDNVLNEIVRLKDGKIFMPFPNFAYDFSNTDDCDLYWRNQHYTSLIDFLSDSEDILMEEWESEHERG